MKIAKLLCGSVLAALAIVACKKQQNETVSNQLNQADSTFISLAGPCNSSQVQTANLAISKSADSAVLSYAQQILAEYSKAQTDLKVMGTIVGFTVSDTIDTVHATIISQLETLTGGTFDTAYIRTQLADYPSIVTFYNDEIKNGLQINVKAYANSILQNIQLDVQKADSTAGH